MKNKECWFACCLNKFLLTVPQSWQSTFFIDWHWKSECAAEMKIAKLYAFQVTSRTRMTAPSLARFTKKKTKTNGNHFRSIRRNRKSLRVTSRPPATMSFSIVMIVCCRSIREGEKKRQNSENSARWYNKYFVADPTPRNHKMKSESTVGLKKYLSCFKKSSRGHLEPGEKDEEIPLEIRRFQRCLA